MRLRTIRETPLKPLDRVFRQSRLMQFVPLFFGLGMWALGAFLFVHGQRALGWLVGGFSLLMLLLFARVFINTFRSENWLVRYSAPRLFIKIRSVHNHRLSDDDRVVLELDTSEIAWIRKFHEKVITAGTGTDGNNVEARAYLELKLRTDDLSELVDQLAAERQRSHKGGKYLHYPVRAFTGRTIQIEWRSPMSWVTPKVEQAMAMLATVVEVRDEEMELRDYTVAPADKAKQEAQILELTERGRHIAAIKLARHRYGYSLKQAKEFVEGLQGSRVRSQEDR